MLLGDLSLPSPRCISRVPLVSRSPHNDWWKPTPNHMDSGTRAPSHVFGQGWSCRLPTINAWFEPCFLCVRGGQIVKVYCRTIYLFGKRVVLGNSVVTTDH